MARPRAREREIPGGVSVGGQIERSIRRYPRMIPTGLVLDSGFNVSELEHGQG